MKKDKFFILIMALIITRALFSIGGQESMNNETHNFNLQGFTGITAIGSFEIETIQSDQFSVNIIAGTSLMKKYIVEKHGENLYLGIKPFSGFNLSKKSPKVIISMPDLQHIELSGTSSMNVKGFNSQSDIRIEQAGNTSLDLEISARNVRFTLSGNSTASGALSSADLTINLSGSSTIKLIGSGKNLDADIAGSSKGFLKDMPVNDAQLKLSGSSEFQVNMDGTLDICASGSAKLYYTGNINMGNHKLSGASSAIRD